MSLYENPEVDHSVNTSEGSPLGEFLSLSLWLALGTALLVATLTLGTRWLAPHVPYRWEVRMAEHVVPQVLAQLESDGQAPTAQANPAPPVAEQRRAWLQALADGLRPAMGMHDMPITVHWSGSDTPNAFATLGGHIVIHQGFLDRVGSENAVAMVMAHEMAHVKHRDAVVGLGSALVLGLSAGLLFGSGTLAGEAATTLSQLHFSREQERAADAAALMALQQHYGHTRDAEAFFAHMLCEAQHSPLPDGPKWLQSHPDTAARIQHIQAQRSASPASATPSASSTLRPLPAFVQQSPQAAECKTP